MTAKDDDHAPWDDVPDTITNGDGLDRAGRRKKLAGRLAKLAVYTTDNSRSVSGRKRSSRRGVDVVPDG